MPRPSIVAAVLALLVGLLLVPLSPLDAQTVVVAQEESFRLSPDGGVLGVVAPGMELRVVQRDAGWALVELEGWVWIQSLQVDSRGGFDLVVSADGGEDLRSSPGGAVLGRLREGTLLEELERRPGWIRVLRTAWIRDPGADPEPADPEPADPEPADPEPAPGPDLDEASEPRPPAVPPPAPVAGAVVLSAPDGDTLASARALADLEVVAREGNWVRVRMEGWTWAPEGEEDGANPGAGGAVLRDVTPAEIAADPEPYRGRVVDLELQFISLERAERVRTDFYEGEPFLLARSVEGERVFVYVAVPPERVEGVEALAPLERIRVTGRIRTGSAALTGSPIVELRELRTAESR